MLDHAEYQHISTLQVGGEPGALVVVALAGILKGGEPWTQRRAEAPTICHEDLVEIVML